MTGSVAVAVEVATGAERFVCPSNGDEVLRRGALAGYLPVHQHWYHGAGEGSHEAAVLVTPAAGARLAAVRAGGIRPAHPFPRRAPVR